MFAEGAEVLVLGAAQDGGVPQIGCHCRNCKFARSESKPQYAVSLAIIDHPGKSTWLIDCGPDIKGQYDDLQTYCPGYTLRGVLLTHLHMGHYVGLFQFGKEALNLTGLKVYGTRQVCDFLRSNQPWSHNLQCGLFVEEEVVAGRGLQLSPRVEVTPVLVPHRQELSDTVAFTVRGCGSGARSVFWCPDIDTWDGWDRDVREVVAQHDTSFLDACFYSADELPGRDVKVIPHPFVTDSAVRLKGLEERVVLIHMNHSNPIWDESSPERARVLELGFRIGAQGTTYPLCTSLS
mmetsp:Transcript_38801/g.86312  ORF Transcript_38801/g.86312 Transcript_38801/m.86312 type:complete len:292 (+) Transcript_38801:187-1062(+)